MSSGLPVHIQVKKAVANAIGLEGELNISSLTRLHTSLLKPEGKVSVKLDFNRGEDKRAWLRGSLRADLIMQCQRCMGEMIYPLNAELALKLVNSDSDSKDEDESIEFVDDQLLLHEVIEDELILALPVVPMHENVEECDGSQMLQEYMKQDADNERNPFAVLKQLKPNSTSTR